MTRKLLSDILHGNDTYFDDWGDVQAADEFGPVPPGYYVTHLAGSELAESKTKGTPSYKLVFKIIEGDYTGRKLWYDIWLTDASKPQAKRDFAKLGITDPKRQLEGPLPQGIRCGCKVALRRADDGTEFNKVQTFEVLGIDAPEVDAFAPADDATAPKPAESEGGTDDRF